MKFTLDKASLEAFNQYGWVEIDGLFTPDQISSINNEIDRLIVEEKLEKKEEIMAFGRNLFQKIEGFNKLLRIKSLAEIVYELSSVKPLRLAYDQLYQSAMSSFDQARVSQFLRGTSSLSELSSVNELILGIMIALKPSAEQLPFSGEAGRVVFFRPDQEIPLEVLKSRLADRYLLLAFSNHRALYLHNDKDPMNHYLKSKGYVYGDKLKESDHPLILR
ncbi:MAG: hypothetical protein KDK62_04425 [Chlamydiia bacterium]|nr:hypothetical protein [Chlamydiia bacterium]